MPTLRLFAAVQHMRLLLADEAPRRNVMEPRARLAGAGPGWSEVFINASSAAGMQTPAEAVLQGHSLLLLHGLASTEECDRLRTEAVRYASWRRENPRPYATKNAAKIRSPINEMLGLADQVLCDTLLQRALALLRAEHPILLPRLFGDILSVETGVATNPALTFTPGE